MKSIALMYSPGVAMGDESLSEMRFAFGERKVEIASSSFSRYDIGEIPKPSASLCGVRFLTKRINSNSSCIYSYSQLVLADEVIEGADARRHQRASLLL